MLEELPEKTFGAVHADVPWSFKVRTPAGEGRSASRHYATMSLPDIKAMGKDVKRVAAKNCHLFFWTTQPFLPDALDIMREWGFKFSSVAFTWIKLKPEVLAEQFTPLHLVEADLHVGLGMTTRKNSELCLLGRRGSPKRLAKDVREVILSPVREHSRKPDETYDRIKAYCAGPYLDLFARQERSGWTSWGNETKLFAKLSKDSPCASTATVGPTPIETLLME